MVSVYTPHATALSDKAKKIIDKYKKSNPSAQDIIKKFKDRENSDGDSGGGTGGGGCTACG